MNHFVSRIGARLGNWNDRHIGITTGSRKLRAGGGWSIASRDGSTSEGIGQEDDGMSERAQNATAPLSMAQARIVRDCWLRGWSVQEIARYLDVNPWRIDTAQASVEPRQARELGHGPD